VNSQDYLRGLLRTLQSDKNTCNRTTVSRGTVFFVYGEKYIASTRVSPNIISEH